MFGLPQNKANQWIHTLLPVLQSTLQQTGDAPARTIEELKNHLHERVQPEEPPPLFVTMAPNDGFLAHKTLMNRKAIIAARKNVTR